MLNDRPTLVDTVASLIPQNLPPLASHIAAVSAFRFIITTNWDLLFEAAYRQIGQRYQILMEEADAPMLNYDQHNLLKIHRLNRPAAQSRVNDGGLRGLPVPPIPSFSIASQIFFTTIPCCSSGMVFATSIFVGC